MKREEKNELAGSAFLEVQSSIGIQWMVSERCGNDGGRAFVDVVLLLRTRGEAPLGSGFGAFVFNGWCQKVVRKMMVFGVPAPVWGSDV